MAKPTNQKSYPHTFVDIVYVLQKPYYKEASEVGNLYKIIYKKVVYGIRHICKDQVCVWLVPQWEENEHKRSN